MLSEKELMLLAIMEDFGDNVIIKFDESEVIKKLAHKLRESKKDFKELQRKYSGLECNYNEIVEKHAKASCMIRDWMAKAGEIVGNPPDEEWDLDNDKDQDEE